MKKVLHILAFPFILALSILKALLAKPFAFRLGKEGKGEPCYDCDGKGEIEDNAPICGACGGDATICDGC